MGSVSRKVKEFNASRASEKGRFKDFVRPIGKLYWFHCASLGEYEQVKPVIQELKKRDGNFTIITFFSPSGYEILKQKNLADTYITYLPLEDKKTINQFIERVKPDQVFWVKYEFWLVALEAIFSHKAPCYLISANFTPHHFVTRIWADPWRILLKKFTQIFVQNESSRKVLEGIGVKSTIAGDTRFDNVKILASEGYVNIELASWKGNDFLIVAGSSWKGEEDRLISFLIANPSIKSLIAPHDISKANIQHLSERLRTAGINYSFWDQRYDIRSQVIVINGIGALNRVYKYANIAYVGGGYKKGLHNILEPMAWGIPVMTGPNIENNWEALEAKNEGLLFVVNNQSDIEGICNKVLSADSYATNTMDFVSKYGRASETILDTV